MAWGRRRSRYDDEPRWPVYVPVAQRKKQAASHLKSLEKKGQKTNPIVIEGRNIAKTFWGKAWCENLESYSDYENRLPRGRTYVRNGSVIDLQITKGQVLAHVMGSSLYKITINVKPILKAKWDSLVKSCSGKIDSLIELLQGKFSKGVMEIITQDEVGLFPQKQEISMACSCPDSAGMCKHIAAVLYGVGASLDAKPEWLFDLRHVNHLDLISSANANGALMQNQSSENMLEDSDLSALFGIEIDAGKNASLKKKGSAPTKTALKEAKATPNKTNSMQANQIKKETKPKSLKADLKKVAEKKVVRNEVDTKKPVKIMKVSKAETTASNTRPRLRPLKTIASAKGTKPKTPEKPPKKKKKSTL